MPREPGSIPTTSFLDDSHTTMIAIATASRTKCTCAKSLVTEELDRHRFAHPEAIASPTATGTHAGKPGSAERDAAHATVRSAADAGAVALAVIALIGSVVVRNAREAAVSEHRLSDGLGAAIYPGGSPSEIRDAIVKPIEDAIAGAPNLDFLTSSIQHGPSLDHRAFLLNSDKTTDWSKFNVACSPPRRLPSDSKTPFIGSFDPGEAERRDAAAGSSSLIARGALG